MAAMRSVSTMLGRRCVVSSGSSVVASMGGRGPEINQLFRPAAPRTTLPFGPAAVRNAERWRRFSTAGGEQANKAEGLRMWWQRAKKRVENANVAERSQAVFVYSVVSLGATACYVGKSMLDILRRP